MVLEPRYCSLVKGRVQRRALSLGDSDDHVERTNV